MDKNLNTNAWKIFAVFNHDLQQVFVGASDAPMHQMGRECDAVARTLANWQCTTHNIEHIEAVESFPTHRHAQMYATWLKREGAFEGTEHYGMGLQASLVSAA